MLTTIISLYFTSLVNSENLIIPEIHTAHAAQYERTLHIRPIPQQRDQSIPEPSLTANASIVVDLNSNKVLWEKNSNERKSIGSITKLMTALIILDENELNDVVTVTKKAANIPGSQIWLPAGEKFTVRDLLYATLIQSANDATYALAEHNAGSVEQFVEKMNTKAQRLGLKNTQFSNPAGFDSENNYSTGYDVNLLSQYAYRKAFIRHATEKKSMQLISLTGRTYNLESTNKLLGNDERVKGLKTGSTVDAGKSFVGISTIKDGHPVLTVILNSQDRFGETQKILNWVEEFFQY